MRRKPPLVGEALTGDPRVTDARAPFDKSPQISVDLRSRSQHRTTRQNGRVGYDSSRT